MNLSSTKYRIVATTDVLSRMSDIFTKLKGFTKEPQLHYFLIELGVKQNFFQNNLQTRGFLNTCTFDGARTLTLDCSTTAGPLTGFLGGLKSILPKVKTYYTCFDHENKVYETTDPKMQGLVVVTLNGQDFVCTKKEAFEKVFNITRVEVQNISEARKAAKEFTRNNEQDFELLVNSISKARKK